MASDTTTAAGTARQERRRDLRNYALVTGAYWTDTLVDGAIRTLVLFYFDRLGYSGEAPNPVRESRTLMYGESVQLSGAS
jgi:hypothetical protein